MGATILCSWRGDEGKAPKGDGGLKSIEPKCLNELLDHWNSNQEKNPV